MATQRRFRMPGQVIALDLFGTLLVLAGAFDLAGIHLPLPFLEAAAGKGVILISAGVGLMILGAVVLVARLVAARKSTPSGPAGGGGTAATIKTVERRPR